MGRRHPAGHSMATDTGESLTAILPTSVWFPTTPLLSFSWKICGFPVTGMLAPRLRHPTTISPARAVPICPSSSSTTWDLSPSVLPVTLGKNRAKLLTKTMGPMALVASAAQRVDSSHYLQTSGPLCLTYLAHHRVGKGPYLQSPPDNHQL